MFGKKKRKKALFGAAVEPRCEYCRHNSGKQGDAPFCTLRLELDGGKCKRYQYDPLRREPRTAPPLRENNFSEEDFKL